LGNAITWKARAQAAGYATGTVPKAGAVAWVVHPSTSLGHVAYVESVNPDGSFVLYEMNAIGWNKVSSQTVPASKAGSQYIFIY
jgi:surface antigen